MTQVESIIDLFRRNGYRLTLGKLLQYPFGYKSTSRFSDLRKMGYVINCHKGRRPSENVYEMIEPESNGQTRLCA
jgi:hypothetical protein